MSDEPGNYGDDELRSLLAAYLTEDGPTPRRIRRVLLPLCLEHGPVTRDDIKQALMHQGEAEDERQAGLITATISGALGVKARDYLRQVIRYDKPRPWKKDGYRIDDGYRDMVCNLVAQLQDTEAE